MGNNVLEPIPDSLNDYLLKYNKTTLNDTQPAPSPGSVNVSWSSDQFGNIAASVPQINTSSIDITGGTIDGTAIGSTTPDSGVFTTLKAGVSGLVEVAPYPGEPTSFNVLSLNGQLSDGQRVGLVGGGDGNINIDFTGAVQIRGAGGNGVALSVASSGQLSWPSGYPTATSATAGAATALPATPTGYLEVSISGTTFKIPYYSS